MEKTLELASRAARSSMPVLVVGPSGTGKELIARFIHERGERARKPFLSINCAAIPEGLMEAELFGYERGAFTGAVAQRIGRFERASGGTLLLDEVSEMPVHLQAKLLRVLQEGEIDRLGGSHPIPIRTRIIATTNVEPLELIRKEAFRADLFYRLNVIRIDCAPLSGRPEAIATLAVELLRKACDAAGSGPKRLAPGALEKLCAYGWPGNVRELQNALERAVLLSDSETVSEEQLDLRALHLPEPESTPVDLAGLEQKHILSMVEQTQGNRTEAARRLGISVRTLHNKLKAFGS
jgi:two-component system response regulator FlrC